jgi:hypothetical protein
MGEARSRRMGTPGRQDRLLMVHRRTAQRGDPAMRLCLWSFPTPRPAWPDAGRSERGDAELQSAAPLRPGPLGRPLGPRALETMTNRWRIGLLHPISGRHATLGGTPACSRSDGLSAVFAGRSCPESLPELASGRARLGHTVPIDVVQQVRWRAPADLVARSSAKVRPLRRFFFGRGRVDGRVGGGWACGVVSRSCFASPRPRAIE